MSGNQDESNVVDEENSKEDKELKFNEEVTELKSSVKMYTWSLEPQNVQLRGIIFIAHGFGEHSRRYDGFARLLCSELDCLVVSHDHIGHGRSEGERAMIETFDDYVEDIFAHLDKIKQSQPDLPIYLFGHSMGGSISILAASKKPEYFKAVVISAPAIIIDPATAPGTLKTFIGKMLNHIFPRLEIVPPVDPSVLSNDVDQVEAYRTDPLVWHGGIKLRFATAFANAADKIKEIIPTIEWPFLVVHGEEDKLTYIGGSQLLEKDAKSKDKEIKTYKGLKHEMLNEKKDDAEKVISDIVEWLRKRIEL